MKSIQTYHGQSYQTRQIGLWTTRTDVHVKQVWTKIIFVTSLVILIIASNESEMIQIGIFKEKLE